MEPENKHTCECGHNCEHEEGEECSCCSESPSTNFLHAFDLCKEFFPNNVKKIAEITTTEPNQEIILFSPSGIREDIGSISTDAAPSLAVKIDTPGTYPIYTVNILSAEYTVPTEGKLSDEDKKKNIAISIIESFCSFAAFFLIDTRSSCKQHFNDRFRSEYKKLAKAIDDISKEKEINEEEIDSIYDSAFYGPVDIGNLEAKYYIGKEAYSGKELLEKIKDDEDFNKDEEEEELNEGDFCVSVTSDDGLLSISTTSQYQDFFEGSMKMKFKTYKKFVQRLLAATEDETAGDETEDVAGPDILTHVADGIDFRRDAISENPGKICCMRATEPNSLLSFAALREFKILDKEEEENATENENVEDKDTMVDVYPNGELFAIVGVIEPNDFDDEEEIEIDEENAENEEK